MSAAAQRQAMVDLAALAVRELEALWAYLVSLTAPQVRDALVEELPPIGEKYGAAAAALAAEWYATARSAAAAPGSFTPVLATPPTPARWESLARWGVDPLFSEEPRPDVALTLVSGGLQRSVADQHRLTVVESAIADPAAQGWRRVGTGATCDFCRELLGRGAVYTEASVSFRTHDHCRCAASPAWNPDVVDMTHVRDKFQHSTRFGTDEARRKNARRLADYAANNK